MTAKRTQVPACCHGHSRPIVEVNYSPITPDGYFLTSASKDGQPMLRDGRTGDWIGTFVGHKGAVWSCQLNDPALLAATGSADFTAKLWDALTGDVRHTFQHNHIVRTVGFSHQSNKLMTGGQEKLVRIFDLEKVDAEPLRLEGFSSNLRCSSWLHNDKTLLITCMDHPGICALDMRTQQQEMLLPTKQPVSSVQLSFCGKYLTTTDGRTVTFWDTSSLTIIKEYTMSYTVESASYSPHKGKFITGGHDCWVQLYNFEHGEELECNKAHHGPVHAVAFGPTGKEYASGSEDGTIRIWQTDFLEQEHAVQPQQPQQPMAAGPVVNGATA